MFPRQVGSFSSFTFQCEHISFVHNYGISGWINNANICKYSIRYISFLGILFILQNYNFLLFELFPCGGYIGNVIIWFSPFLDSLKEHLQWADPGSTNNPMFYGTLTHHLLILWLEHYSTFTKTCRQQEEHS